MKLKQTPADLQIQNCLDEKKSFTVIAGAGSGKTTSLVNALNYVNTNYGQLLRRDGQRIVCITYTKRARDVLRNRLKYDDLFVVSTIHSFLWGEISRFSQDITKVICEKIIPEKISKYREVSNGSSQRALQNQKNIAKLEELLPQINEVTKFEYHEANFSNFENSQIGHDDVIDIATKLINSSPLLQNIIGQKYPYTFVDEAQDTFPEVIKAINQICSGDSLPIVGYFGDPMQQIYDKRAGHFEGPLNYIKIRNVHF